MRFFPISAVGSHLLDVHHCVLHEFQHVFVRAFYCSVSNIPGSFLGDKNQLNVCAFAICMWCMVIVTMVVILHSLSTSHGMGLNGWYQIICHLVNTQHPHFIHNIYSIFRRSNRRTMCDLCLARAKWMPSSLVQQNIWSGTGKIIEFKLALFEHFFQITNGFYHCLSSYLWNRFNTSVTPCDHFSKQTLVADSGMPNHESILNC